MCKRSIGISVKVIKKRILDYVCFKSDIVFIPLALFTAFKYSNIRKTTKFNIELSVRANKRLGSIKERH